MKNVWMKGMTLILVLMLCISGCTALAETETVKVLYIAKNLSDYYCNWMSAMVEEALQSYPNVEYTVLDQQGDAALTEGYVDMAVIDGYDALIIDKTSSSQNCDDMLKAVMEKGVKVVAANNRCDDTIINYVGSDNFKLGYMGGEYAAEMLPENAKCIAFLSTAGNAASEDRWSGYQQALADKGRDDVEILYVANCDGFSKDIAKATMEDMCIRFEQIDGVISVNDGMAIGAIEACEADGRDISKIMSFGIDGLEDACLAVQSGRQTASVLQNARNIGYAAVDLAMKLVSGEVTEVTVIEETPVLITAENISEIVEMHRANGIMK